MHFRNILNASLTLVIFHCVSLFFFTGFVFALISFGIIEGEIYGEGAGGGWYTPNPIPGIVYLAIYMCVLLYIFVSTIIVGMAARKGKIVLYRGAIRFFKIVSVLPSDSSNQ
jgi:hypothetical protein